MSASLVGSEMCIRDSCGGVLALLLLQRNWSRTSTVRSGLEQFPACSREACLLYTSDAADDM
eukprot:12202976-Alexandrium_andersonii.AAC.1